MPPAMVVLTLWGKGVPVMKRLGILSVALLAAGCGKMESSLPNLVHHAEAKQTPAEVTTVEYFEGTVDMFGKQVKLRREVRLDADGNYIKHGRASAWYASGQKASDMTYDEDRPNGLERSWHENGKKKMIGESKQGLAGGKWIEWYDNGQKYSEGEYLDGERHGLWTFWEPSGEVKESVEYRFGKKLGVAEKSADRINR